MAIHDNQNKPAPLTYQLSQKGKVLIISFSGALTKKDESVLEQCRKAIAKSSCKWVLLDFKNAHPEIDKSVLPAFARLQQGIRAMQAELRIVFLSNNARKFLDSQGVLRGNELMVEIPDAILALLQPSTTQAA